MIRQYLYTATQLSIALGISRIAFFGFGPKPRGRERRSYGNVFVFDPDRLPDQLQAMLREAMLREARSTRRCTTVEEFIRLRVQERRRAAIPEMLTQRLSPGRKVFAMRDVIEHYLAHRDCGRPEVDSNVSARAEFLKKFRRTISEKQIRRLAKRVTDAGGPELAPIDAYAEQKSVSHARGGERRNPRCSGDGRCTPSTS